MKACVRRSIMTRIWTSFAICITRTSTKNTKFASYCSCLALISMLWQQMERWISFTWKSTFCHSARGSDCQCRKWSHFSSSFLQRVLHRRDRSMRYDIPKAICSPRRCRNLWTIWCCWTFTRREHTFWTCNQCWRNSLASRSIFNR